MKLQVVSRRIPHRRENAFTLIEILLVIVILLLLASALVVFVLPQQKGAEKNTTRIMLQQVANALDTYRMNLGHYPTEQEGGLDALLRKPTFESETMGEKWLGPYLKPGTTLEDPWGHKIHYELNDIMSGSGTGSDTERTGGLPYKLYSLGPDNQPDTDDDIRLGGKSSSDTQQTTTGD